MLNFVFTAELLYSWQLWLLVHTSKVKYETRFKFDGFELKDQHFCELASNSSSTIFIFLKNFYIFQLQPNRDKPLPIYFGLF